MQKHAVERADQLPVHSYAVTALPSVVLREQAAIAQLADLVRADLEADLDAYEICYRNALRAYYRALSMIGLLLHHSDAAIEFENRARELEEKASARMLSGLTLRPLVAAQKAGANGAAQTFSEALAAELARLHYDVVRAELKATRARLETLSPAFLEGRAAGEIDPAAHAGRISKDMALMLLNMSYAFHCVLPYRDEIVQQLSQLIGAHREEKADIWDARDVSLEGRTRLTPVNVAIFDTGVDPTVFRDRMWTNRGEILAKDGDESHHHDAEHGIAWSWNGEPR